MPISFCDLLHGELPQDLARISLKLEIHYPRASQSKIEHVRPKITPAVLVKKTVISTTIKQAPSPQLSHSKGPTPPQAC